MIAAIDPLAARIGADLTAELLLRYYREPGLFHSEARRRNALPVDGDVVLKLALGRRIEFTDPALNEARTLDALKAGAAMYVRHVFFRPDATPYQILGLAQGASATAIKERFRLLMQLVHPDRQDSGDAWPESFAALANRAYGMLRDENARTAFDRDAEARARVARAVYRTAAAAEASMMPVPLWPAGRLGRGHPLGGVVLPEWLTVGVGGYVRAHPAVVMFGVLIAGAALVVLTSMRDGSEGMLAREVREVLVAAHPAIPSFSRASSDAAVANAGTRTPPLRAASAADERAHRTAGSALSVPEPSGKSNDDSLPKANVPVEQGVMASNVRTSGGSATAMAAVASAAPPVVSLPPVAPTVQAMPSLPVASEAPPSVPSPSTQLVTEASLARAADPAARAEPVAVSPQPVAASLPPASPEIEALFAEFVDNYERGRLDAFAALFDDDADTNLRHGRAAIRNEYDELFRLSSWRRMQLTRINWRRAGDKAYANGEIAVRIGWRDGREVEQKLAVEMELVRRDGRAVIARLSHQPKNP